MVKGERFDGWRSVGIAMQAARTHAMRGVDELMLLDIAATPNGRKPDVEIVAALSEHCFTPLTVGGGITQASDVQPLLNAGADKVSVNTAAVERPSLVAEIARRYGRQALVVSIDVRNGGVVTRCGKQSTGMNPVYWAIQCEQLGAGEIMVNDCDRDGTMAGYNLDLIAAVSNAVSVPVIACGGCADYADMEKAVKAGASAVAAGAMFQFTDATPRGAAEYLQSAGIEARV